MIKIIISSLFCSLCMVCYSQVLAQEHNRPYTRLYDNAYEYHIALLAQPVNIRFPNAVKTVGQAIEYALRQSGYSHFLANRDNEISFLLSRPLPRIHRQLGPMTLARLLRTLVGAGYDIAENPWYRRVAIVVKPPVSSNE